MSTECQACKDFNKGWAAAKAGEPLGDREDDERSGWIVFNYDDLRQTVLMSCNPPDDCDHPAVLKRYMKACFDKASE